MTDQHERRYAQPTVRMTVTSGSGHMSSDSDMIVRNPAPDASPPSVPPGTTHTFTLTSAPRW